MTKETKTEKAKRLLTTGCVLVEFADEEKIMTKVVGDTNEYRVWATGDQYRCSCPNRQGDCSHIEAVKMIWRSR